MNLKPDLIFIDVEMPPKTGFDLTKQLAEIDFDPMIVFFTAHSEYAIAAIKNSAFDFLLKPVDPEELDETIQRLIVNRQSNDIRDKIKLLVNNLEKGSKRLEFITRTGVIFVYPDDIFYCAADGNYTYIFLLKKRMECITIKIGKVFEYISQFSQDFLRAGRSLIINSKYLHKIERATKIAILVCDEERIEIDLPHSFVKEYFK